jgi:hypothetical protein
VSPEEERWIDIVLQEGRRAGSSTRPPARRSPFNRAKCRGKECATASKPYVDSSRRPEYARKTSSSGPVI